MRPLLWHGRLARGRGGMIANDALTLQTHVSMRGFGG